MRQMATTNYHRLFEGQTDRVVIGPSGFKGGPGWAYVCKDFFDYPKTNRLVVVHMEFVPLVLPDPNLQRRAVRVSERVAARQMLPCDRTSSYLSIHCSTSSRAVTPVRKVKHDGFESSGVVVADGGGTSQESHLIGRLKLGARLEILEWDQDVIEKPHRNCSTARQRRKYEVSRNASRNEICCSLKSHHVSKNGRNASGTTGCILACRADSHAFEQHYISHPVAARPHR